MGMDDRRTFCPILDVDGVISGGKQFDLDITLPEDNRDVIYGIVKDCFKEPVCNAVVKLVEVVCEHGKEERRPIGHTFTDKEGEFVFGPLCPGKEYALQIWVNDTKKIKICAKCHHEGKCLKGEKCEKCDCFIDNEKDDCKKYDKYEEYDKKDDCKKCDKYEEYDKKDEHKKCDKYEEHDKKDDCKKCDKYEEYDKKDEHKKCDKYEEYDKKDECKKCNKYEEYDKKECFKKSAY